MAGAPAGGVASEAPRRALRPRDTRVAHADRRPGRGACGGRGPPCAAAFTLLCFSDSILRATGRVASDGRPDVMATGGAGQAAVGAQQRGGTSAGEVLPVVGAFRAPPAGAACSLVTRLLPTHRLARSWSLLGVAPTLPQGARDERRLATASGTFSLLDASALTPVSPTSLPAAVSMARRRTGHGGAAPGGRTQERRAGLPLQKWSDVALRPKQPLPRPLCSPWRARPPVGRCVAHPRVGAARRRYTAGPGRFACLAAGPGHARLAPRPTRRARPSCPSSTTRPPPRRGTSSSPTRTLC